MVVRLDLQKSPPPYSRRFDPGFDFDGVIFPIVARRTLIYFFTELGNYRYTSCVIPTKPPPPQDYDTKV